MAKGLYIGATTAVPVYTTTTTKTDITSSNYSTYFSQSGNTNYLSISGSNFYLRGSKSSTRYVTFTMLKAGTYTINYGVSSEANYDTFSISYNGVVKVANISGEVTGTLTLNVSIDDTLQFSYYKDSSGSVGSDRGFWTMSVSTTTTVQTGTRTEENKARKVKNIYFGAKTNVVVSEGWSTLSSNTSSYFTIGYPEASYSHYTSSGSLYGEGANSTVTTEVYIPSTQSLKIEGYSSSESGCDEGIVYYDGSEIFSISGVDTSETYIYDSFPGGDLTVTYEKDGSVDAGDDYVSFEFYTGDYSSRNYPFERSGTTWTPTNKGIHSTTSWVTFTAKSANKFKIDYTYSSESSDPFRLYLNGTSKVNTGGSGSGSIELSLAANDILKMEYYKDSSIHSNNDTCSFTISRWSQTTQSTNNIARRVKKAYIGIGGVARPFWEDGKLSYYGAITPLSEARFGLAAASIGGYAIFGGGHKYYGSYSNGPINIVDAYNASLTRSIPTAFSVERSYLAATTIGNYALFGGGDGEDVNYPAVMEAYNASLTRNNSASLSVGRDILEATTVGGYAIFGGGFGDGGYSAAVDAFNASLTRTTISNLSETKYGIMATTVGNYALFAGGGTSYSTTASVDAYDTSLTRTKPTSLSVSRRSGGAAAVEKYALFAGGYTGSNSTAVVEAYDTSLTRTTITSLSEARSPETTTTLGNYALFGTGNTIDAYDKALTRTTDNSLSVSRSSMAATTVGNYALFGGGDSGKSGTSSMLANVDAYTLI